MAGYRFPTISFGGNVVPEKTPTTFAAEAKPTTPAKEQPQTVADPTAEYLQNHGAYASAGISLEDHVADWAINAKSIVEPTEQQWAVVKKQSAALNEKWARGEVVDPWK